MGKRKAREGAVSQESNAEGTPNGDNGKRSVSFPSLVKRGAPSMRREVIVDTRVGTSSRLACGTCMTHVGVSHSALCLTGSILEESLQM